MPRRPTLTCASCRKPMWSSQTSLPQGQATCRPCRRAARAAFDGPETCQLCAKQLTGIQRRQGNRFCGRACAYRFQCVVHGENMQQTWKRYRRFGWGRPFDVEAEEWLQGPPRRLKLSVHVHPDGSVEVSCPWCFGFGEQQPDATSFWCGDCEGMLHLEKPFVVRDAA